jgi:transcription initiation factor TFIIB
MTRQLLFEVEERRCPACRSAGSLVVDYERGQVICRNCGTVIRDSVVDLGPEWRKPESSRACAGPIGSSLGEVESGAAKIGDRLRSISIKKFARPMSTPSERAEAGIREFLETARQKLNVPKVVIEETIMLYRRLYEAGYRVPRVEGYAAVLYFVAKKYGIAAVTLKDLIERLGVDKSVFMSAYMELMSLAGRLGIKPPRVDPKIYIPKIVSALNLSNEKSAEVQRAAVTLLERILFLPRLRNGRKPQILAAAAVYHTCYVAGIEVTQKELAKAADSTEGSLRELLKELAESIYVEVTI